MKINVGAIVSMGTVKSNQVRKDDSYEAGFPMDAVSKMLQDKNTELYKAAFPEDSIAKRLQSQIIEMAKCE